MKKLISLLLFSTLTASIASSKWAILINVCRHNGGLFGYKNITQVWDLNSLNNNNGVVIANLDCEDPGINACKLKKPLFGGNLSASTDEFGNTPDDIIDKVFDILGEVQSQIDKDVIRNVLTGENMIKVEYQTPKGVGGLVVIEYNWKGEFIKDIPDYCVKFKVYFIKTP